MSPIFLGNASIRDHRVFVQPRLKSAHHLFTDSKEENPSNINEATFKWKGIFPHQKAMINQHTQLLRIHCFHNHKSSLPKTTLSCELMIGLSEYVPSSIVFRRETPWLYVKMLNKIFGRIVKAFLEELQQMNRCTPEENTNQQFFRWCFINHNNYFCKLRCH